MNTQTSPIGYVLKRAQHDLALRMERALSDTGVTLSRYAALGVIRAEGPLSNATLARRCFVTPQTTIRMVKAMESDGLVQRSPNPASGRETLVGLTDAGHRAWADAQARGQQVEEQMLAGFTAEEQASFRTALERIIFNLDEEQNT